MKTFWTIILGQQFKIYTDHRNINCKPFNDDILLKYRLILKGYGAEIKYIRNNINIVTGALSRFPINDNQKAKQESKYIKDIVSKIYNS